jgi:DNA-binding MarR family transcriptional regulator
MLRKVGAQSVLISDLVASRVGLNPTDLECLDLLRLSGATTAGRLAAHTRLTTGAITAVIDRLERAGFVRRRAHPDDRRCVLVEILPRSVARIRPFYVPLGSGMESLHEQYDDDELAVILDYITKAYAIGAVHVAWLQRRSQARGTRRVASHRPVPQRRRLASAPART